MRSRRVDLGELVALERRLQRYSANLVDDLCKAQLYGVSKRIFLVRAWLERTAKLRTWRCSPLDSRSCLAARAIDSRACMHPLVPVPTSLPVSAIAEVRGVNAGRVETREPWATGARKMSTRLRGTSKASCTAANLRGA